jgi:hypothetical protein
MDINLIQAVLIESETEGIYDGMEIPIDGMTLVPIDRELSNEDFMRLYRWKESIFESKINEEEVRGARESYPEYNGKKFSIEDIKLVPIRAGMPNDEFIEKYKGKLIQWHSSLKSSAFRVPVEITSNKLTCDEYDLIRDRGQHTGHLKYDRTYDAKRVQSDTNDNSNWYEVIIPNEEESIFESDEIVEDNIIGVEEYYPYSGRNIDIDINLKLVPITAGMQTSDFIEKYRGKLIQWKSHIDSNKFRVPVDVNQEGLIADEYSVMDGKLKYNQTMDGKLLPVDRPNVIWYEVILNDEESIFESSNRK